ncbi:hypothetical protein [Pseudomonas sp. RIT-PI-o]|uniref:hypothetical protein n=1 Tax=Pseudomonas sp. RIT-PI-o TaxID=1690246 RepID=UPI0006CD2967|nr:hypothetical protein [Pseudomonas sp. RIT-PI-o]KPG82605.1 hypothetical protein AEQ63_11825 [Pseudomonas sp. RIT-PI-o]
MSIVSPLRLALSLAGAVLSCSLLTGCNITGTYQDATDPDAAKVRFVANTDNATIDYFDAEHCDGLTTGMLNNVLIGDSKRRAGMMVAPPEQARGYLEFKIKPEQPAYLRVNTQVGYATCGSGFSFTPKRGNEYEVTLNVTKTQCITTLRHLERHDGKDLRTVMPLDRTALAACVGRNPIFPKPPALLPDTPQRTALIERIIEGSLFVFMKPDAGKEPAASFPPEKLDSLINDRKAKLGFTLPDDYWALYRQNLIEFDKESATTKDQAMQRTKDEYRQRLRSVDDKRLGEWARVDDKDGKRGNAAPDAEEKAMFMFYFQASNRVMAEAIDHHLDRMAAMDAKYEVCSRFADCWKR